MNAMLCLCFLMFVWRVGADCNLGAAYISQANRLFTFRDDNSQVCLQRLDVVPTHQTVEMICSPTDVVRATCQENGILKTPLPLTDCSTPPKGIVEVVKDERCPFTMYRVGYKQSDQLFLELYRSCYDVLKQTAHFVIHLAYPSTIPAPRPRDQTFTTDGVISGLAAAAFQAVNIYATFVETLGPKQKFIASARDLVFDRGHLAPSADFIFEPYMRLSFKYLNVVAQFRGNNRSNWKIIENWIRSQLNNGNFQVLQLCAGGFGVLQLPNSIGELKPIYLKAPSSNPVPKWLFKTVSDGGGTRYAFLSYNNIHDVNIPTPNCVQVACPATLQFKSTKNAGFSFCCDPNDFLTRNLPHLANAC